MLTLVLSPGLLNLKFVPSSFYHMHEVGWQEKDRKCLGGHPKEKGQKESRHAGAWCLGREQWVFQLSEDSVKVNHKGSNLRS